MNTTKNSYNSVDKLRDEYSGKTILCVQPRRTVGDDRRVEGCKNYEDVGRQFKIVDADRTIRTDFPALFATTILLGTVWGFDYWLVLESKEGIRFKELDAALIGRHDDGQPYMTPETFAGTYARRHFKNEKAKESAPTSSEKTRTAKPSFDCNAELNAAEKIVCGKDYIARMDVKMSELYKVGLRRAKRNKDDATALKQSQRAWLADMRRMTVENEIAETYRKRINELEKDFDGEFILAIYSRIKTEGAEFIQSLEAPESWTKGSYDSETETWSPTYFYPEIVSREQCGSWMVESELKNDRFKNFNIDGNIAKGTNGGYSEFHCIPWALWKSMKPKDKNKERDTWNNIEKNPAEFERIKKCKDYKADALFVCDE